VKLAFGTWSKLSRIVLDETVALISSRVGRAMMQLGVADAMEEALGRFGERLTHFWAAAR